MSNEEHYRSLENLYAAAPINAFYNPKMRVRAGESEIEMNVSEKHFHAAGAVHGSVYFKMLDDAAFFAANSLETEVLVLTTAFITYLSRPVSSGKLKAIGRVVNANKSQFIAEAVLYGSTGDEIGRGSGIFVRSRHRLGEAIGYRAQTDQGNQPA